MVYYVLNRFHNCVRASSSVVFVLCINTGIFGAPCRDESITARTATLERRANIFSLSKDLWAHFKKVTARIWRPLPCCVKMKNGGPLTVREWPWIVTHPPAARQHPSSLWITGSWAAAVRRKAQRTSPGSLSGTLTSSSRSLLLPENYHTREAWAGKK